MPTLLSFRWSQPTLKGLHYLLVAKITVFFLSQCINCSYYLKINLRIVNIPIANISKILIFNEDVVKLPTILRK